MRSRRVACVIRCDDVELVRIFYFCIGRIKNRDRSSYRINAEAVGVGSRNGECDSIGNVGRIIGGGGVDDLVGWDVFIDRDIGA